MKQCNKALRSALILFFIVIATLPTLIAQSFDKGLLWEINKSGSPTSYLFGSIHLARKSVINIPDSVLPKILSCTYFANEINPDSISQLVSASIFEEASQLKDVFTKEELEKIRVAYNSRFNENVKSIDKKPLLIFYYTIAENPEYAAQSKTSFLDGFLFDQARNAGKIITGLEPLENQMGVLLRRDTMLKDQILDWLYEREGGAMQTNEMVNLYLAEDLSGLKKLMNKHLSEEERFDLLDKRNVDMVNSFDSITKNKGSLFATVGAAHLYGNRGMLQLLKDRGYTVSPIYSPRTGYFKKVTPQSSFGNWVLGTDSSSGFSFRTPVATQSFEISGLPANMSVDMGTGFTYLILAGTSAKELNSDESFDDLVKSLSKKAKINSSSDVEYKGKFGKEFKLEMEGKTAFMRVLKHEHARIVLMVMEGGNKKLKGSAELDNFYNSIEFFTAATSNWKLAEHKAGAYKSLVLAESKNQIHREKIDEGYITMYYRMMADKTANTYCLAKYNDYHPLTLFFNDSNELEALKEDYGDVFSGKIDTSYQHELQGYPAYTVVGGSSAFAKLTFIFRGERVYITLGTSDSRDEAAMSSINNFLNSFQLIPYDDALLTNNYKSPHHSFNVLTSGMPKLDTLVRYYSTNGIDSIYKFQIYDSTNSMHYHVAEFALSDFFHATSDTSLVMTLMTATDADDDSIVSIKTNKEKTQYEVYTCETTNKYLQTKRSIHLAGKRAFMGYYTTNKLDIEGARASGWLQSLKPTLNYDASFTQKRKTKELLDALLSTDSLTKAYAEKNIRAIDFNKSEQAMLRSFIDKKMSLPADSIESYDVYNIMSKLEYDETSRQFYKTNYNRFNKRAQGKVIDWFLEGKNEADMLQAKEYWLKAPPRSIWDYNFKNISYFDSLELTTKLLPELSMYVNDSDYTDAVCSWLYELVSDTIIQQQQLETIKPNLRQQINKALKSAVDTKTNGDNIYTSLYPALKLLIELTPDAETNTSCRTVLTSNDALASLHAVNYLMANNQTITSGEIRDELKEDLFRKDYFDTLHNKQQTEIIKQLQFNRENLARSELAIACYNYEEYVFDTIIYKGTKKIEVNGEQGIIYYYLLHDSYEHYETGELVNEDYVGIAGPYFNKDDLMETSDFTGMYSEIGEESFSKALDESIDNLKKYANREEE